MPNCGFSTIIVLLPIQLQAVFRKYIIHLPDAHTPYRKYQHFFLRSNAYDSIKTPWAIFFLPVCPYLSSESKSTPYEEKLYFSPVIDLPVTDRILTKHSPESHRRQLRDHERPRCDQQQRQLYHRVLDLCTCRRFRP
jgi:hypothetical protein